MVLGPVIPFEPHELDVMRRTPRAVDQPILDGFGPWRIVFVELVLRSGNTLASDDRARSHLASSTRLSFHGDPLRMQQP